MRVVVARGIAGNLGAFSELGPRAQVQVVHGDKDPPLRGFQPISYVGEGAAYYHTHGKGEVGVLHLLFYEELPYVLPRLYHMSNLLTSRACFSMYSRRL